MKIPLIEYYFALYISANDCRNHHHSNDEDKQKKKQKGKNQKIKVQR